MGSSFSGIELGKRAIASQSEALQTTGHNLSNVNTEGYSRQRVELKATVPLYDPALNREERPGQIGQGTEIVSIARVRDDLLEGRIDSHLSGEAYWGARDQYILQLEKAHNEPAELSIRTRMDKFWESWQDLSLRPDETASRQAVLERGAALADAIHLKHKSLTDVAVALNDDLGVKVGEANQYMRNIASLNVQI